MLQSLQFSAVAAGLDPLHWSVVGPPPPNLGVQVDIPKGFCSEKFLFRKVFILKRHYAGKFYSEIRNNDPSELKPSEWCFGRDKNLQNNDLSK